MIALVVAQGFDPLALTWLLRADVAGLFERGPRSIRVRALRRRNEDIVQQVYRHAPVRDRAGRILLQHAFERAARDQEPIGMDHCDAALKLGLHFGIAGSWEAELAKVLVLLANLCINRAGSQSECHGADSQAGKFFGTVHGSTPMIDMCASLAPNYVVSNANIG